MFFYSVISCKYKTNWSLILNTFFLKDFLPFFTLGQRAHDHVGLMLLWLTKFKCLWLFSWSFFSTLTLYILTLHLNRHIKLHAIFAKIVTQAQGRMQSLQQFEQSWARRCPFRHWKDFSSFTTLVLEILPKVFICPGGQFEFQTKLVLASFSSPLPGACIWNFEIGHFQKRTLQVLMDGSGQGQCSPKSLWLKGVKIKYSKNFSHLYHHGNRVMCVVVFCTSSVNTWPI